MAVTMSSSRAFLLPCNSFSSASYNSFPVNHRGKIPFVISTSYPRAAAPTSRLYQTIVQARRSTWLPGLDPPSYLDGTLPGDFGFDPLGLGEDASSLRWYVQAELVHARFAMAGVAGILLTDILRVTGSNLPVWYEAGAMKFSFASTRTLFIVQLILMGFVETKRYMDFTNPGSQAKGNSFFFGMEAALEGLEPGYPGGPLLNPLGLAKDIKNAHEWKLKEIKNGRLAMVAMLGIFVQASVTHAGPIDNLITHLSDPWHKTLIQTLAGPAS